MENVGRILAWHPLLTEHVSHTYTELSQRLGVPLHVHVLRLADDTREKQGWIFSNFENLEISAIPRLKFLIYIMKVLLENRKEIHIFGSMFEDVRFLVILWFASHLKIRCFVMSEPYSNVPMSYQTNGSKLFESIKLKLRPLIYWLYIRALGDIEGVFAISELAVLQYKKAGVKEDRIFPFGYFVPFQVEEKEFALPVKNKLRTVFVGSLIVRKGVNVLIDAVKAANRNGALVTLDIFGHGELAHDSSEDPSIKVKGVMPFGQVQHVMSNYDVLVLPSFFDGWGVVVNEALCAGIPVICSDAVGANVLLRRFKAGCVFKRGDADQLGYILTRLYNEPNRLAELKIACRSAALKIQPSEAAAYLADILATKHCDRIYVPSPWYPPDR